jgi:hypothetical protein
LANASSSPIAIHAPGQFHQRHNVSSQDSAGRPN